MILDESYKVYMMNYNKILNIGLVCISTTFGAITLGHAENSVLKKAQKENKKILVYATSKSCFFCKKMDKEVLGLAEVKKKINLLLK